MGAIDPDETVEVATPAAVAAAALAAAAAAAAATAEDGGDVEMAVQSEAAAAASAEEAAAASAEEAAGPAVPDAAEAPPLLLLQVLEDRGGGGPAAAVAELAALAETEEEGRETRLARPQRGRGVHAGLGSTRALYTRWVGGVQCSSWSNCRQLQVVDCNFLQALAAQHPSAGLACPALSMLCRLLQRPRLSLNSRA